MAYRPEVLRYAHSAGAQAGQYLKAKVPRRPNPSTAVVADGVGHRSKAAFACKSGDSQYWPSPLQSCSAARSRHGLRAHTHEGEHPQASEEMPSRLSHTQRCAPLPVQEAMRYEPWPIHPDPGWDIRPILNQWRKARLLKANRPECPNTHCLLKRPKSRWQAKEENIRRLPNADASRTVRPL